MSDQFTPQNDLIETEGDDISENLSNLWVNDEDDN
jgi:hypothetical protein